MSVLPSSHAHRQPPESALLGEVFQVRRHHLEVAHRTEYCHHSYVPPLKHSNRAIALFCAAQLAGHHHSPTSLVRHATLSTLRLLIQETGIFRISTRLIMTRFAGQTGSIEPFNKSLWVNREASLSENDLKIRDDSPFSLSYVVAS